MTCLIVDDNAAFLDVAATLLEHEGIRVVGVATTIAEALEQALELRPDVILVDVSLRDESGFDLVRQLADTDVEATLILISTRAESDLEDLLDEAPAAGFVSKAELSAAAIRRLVIAHPET